MKMYINGQNMNMLMLAKMDEPDKAILLNEEKKTYSTIDVSDLSDNPMMKKMDTPDIQFEIPKDYKEL